MKTRNGWLGVAAILLCGGVLLQQGCKQSVKQTGKELHIVALVPLTGPGASLGSYVQNGVMLAKDYIASTYEGKVNISIEYVDSKNQPKDGTSGLQASLMKRKPSAVLAAMSSVSKAIVPMVEKEGIFTIATTTALTDLPKGTKNVVRVYPTSEDYVTPVVTYMIAHHGRIGVLYVHDDFGESNQRVVNDLCKRSGKQVVACEAFELSALDSRQTIARVLAQTPDAVFVTGYGPAFISVFKQLKEAKPDLPIYSELGFANPAVLDALGSAADGILFNGTELELSNPANPHTATFRAAYISRFKAEPYQVAGYAYDSLVFLAKIVAAGADVSPSKQQWVSSAPLDGVMGKINFNSDGECQLTLRVMRRVSGKNVPVE